MYIHKIEVGGERVWKLNKQKDKLTEEPVEMCCKLFITSNVILCSI